MQPLGNYQGLRQSFDPAIALRLCLTGVSATVPEQAWRGEPARDLLPDIPGDRVAQPWEEAGPRSGVRLREAALGTFLVLGFTLRNITEGVGTAAPVLKEKPKLAHFAGLVLLGGGASDPGDLDRRLRLLESRRDHLPVHRGRGNPAGDLPGNAAPPEGLRRE